MKLSVILRSLLSSCFLITLTPVFAKEVGAPTIEPATVEYGVQQAGAAVVTTDQSPSYPILVDANGDGVPETVLTGPDDLKFYKKTK